MSHAAPRLQLPEGPYQLMPQLTDEEFKMLRDDIRQHGVLVPIVLDDQGHVLDGHHRLACIASLEMETPGLTIPYDTEIRRNLTEDGKRDFVIALNLKRRHLSADQRLSLLIQLRTNGNTVTQIAELVGDTSATTVWRRLQEAEAAGLTTQPAYTTGKDGKLYPSRYVPASYMSHTELVKEERTADRAERRSTPPANFPSASESYDIFTGDITDGDAIVERIGPGTVDAIVCDPPYPQEYVPLMEHLSYVASKVLKPGRPLIAMLGHAYIPDYIKLLGTHLKYHWTIADVLGGQNSVQHVWNAFVGWKPVFVFTNGPAQLPFYFLDTVKSPGPDKEFHVWGQDVKTFEILLYRFTEPGARVCDPFLGGGTTAIAALQMSRRFVGFDNDPAAVAITLNRLAELAASPQRAADLTPEDRPVVEGATDV